MPGYYAAFSKDCRLLAVNYQDAGISIWDLAAKKERVHITIVRPRWAADLAFADGDRTLVTVMSKDKDHSKPGPTLWNYSIVHWDVVTGKELATHVLDPTIQFKSLSPDGRHAVFENQAGQTVFDTATGKSSFAIAFTVGSNGESIFSDDGSTLVSYNGNEIIALDVPSGTETKRLKFPLPNKHQLLVESLPLARQEAAGDRQDERNQSRGAAQSRIGKTHRPV